MEYLTQKLDKNSYKLLGKENSPDRFSKFQSLIFIKLNKSQDFEGLSGTLFKFKDFPRLSWTCGSLKMSSHNTGLLFRQLG